MNYIVVDSGLDDIIIKDFLKFPSLIYNKDCPQDKQTEISILYGKHTLSKYFNVMPFVAYYNNDKGKTISARCLVTIYPNDECAYIGYFECVNNIEICNAMLTTAETFIKTNGKTKVIGPVDASFWINYRFKSRSTLPFNKTYTCEPYNKDYYTKLWEMCGYNISDEYESNFYRQVKCDDLSKKLADRLNMLYDKGYRITTPTRKTFDKSLEDVYYILSDTYKNFPIYKSIALNEFIELFKQLKYILNFNMVKIVYQNDKAVAFIINIPNYNVYNIHNLSIINLLKIRLKPKEYVLLYMGVYKEHLGIGSALAEDTKNSLLNNKCKSIGALIHKGKVTSNYYKDLITDKSEYVLFKKYIG